MAENSPPPASAENDEEAARLAAAARDFEVLKPIPATPKDSPVWRVLEAIGRYAIFAGLVASVLGYFLSSLGPIFAWAAIFYLITIILLIIYIPVMFRVNRRERAEFVRANREKQEHDRAEVARLVLEQSQQEEENSGSPQRHGDTEN